MKTPPLEYKITEEMLQALFQGKKVIFDYAGLPQVTLYPPNYGYFITYEKKAEIERLAHFKAFEEIIQALKG